LDSPSALRDKIVEPILEVKTDDAPRAVEALMGTPGILDAAMFGRTLHVTVEDADTGADLVRNSLRSAQRTVERIVTIKPSLEDVFVSLVRAEGGAVVG
jgi:ABC-2 type transport system ATP-binding protein